MATPPTAKTFTAMLDPHEEIDWLADCSDILEAAEQIDTYTLTVLAEAVALGFTIMSGSGRDHAKAAVDGTSDKGVLYWATIDSAYQANAAFDGTGTSLPVELEIVTNSSPARTRQRTFLTKVAQQ